MLTGSFAQWLFIVAAWYGFTSITFERLSPHIEGSSIVQPLSWSLYVSSACFFHRWFCFNALPDFVGETRTDYVNPSANAGDDDLQDFLSTYVVKARPAVVKLAVTTASLPAYLQIDDSPSSPKGYTTINAGAEEDEEVEAGEDGAKDDELLIVDVAGGSYCLLHQGFTCNGTNHPSKNIYGVRFCPSVACNSGQR